jgi:hypothetical protein
VSPNTLRLAGILILISAALAAVLNLHRVADLRMPWLGPLLLVLGAVVVALARRGTR